MKEKKEKKERPEKKQPVVKQTNPIPPPEPRMSVPVVDEATLNPKQRKEYHSNLVNLYKLNIHRHNVISEKNETAKRYKGEIEGIEANEAMIIKKIKALSIPLPLLDKPKPEEAKTEEKKGDDSSNGKVIQGETQGGNSESED
jgi:hypothetical protein